MRQLAWLHAIPEGAKKPRITAIKEVDENSSSLQLPDLDGAEYLVGLLHEAGLMSSNGMGSVCLSWSEINAWLQVTEIDLTLWERLTITELSEVYVGELNKASAKDSEAPYKPTPDVEEVDRALVDKKIRNVFSMFKKVAEPVTED